MRSSNDQDRSISVTLQHQPDSDQLVHLACDLGQSCSFEHGSVLVATSYV